ncbi:Crp/Fnr family transcriptional regulator [Porphyromonas loveana]|uniref:CRP-like cAMP-binding protein n=1 Tax=Porphyromonas loveana TaxID=1884669 RepID=A0A2U1FEL6_9PORP|nr:Crp/Fnr family transcriptional regulator [Porphyromonas loveana]PVZ10637.1 CRP-like cAMP-binding protein [Porphyromonas loveana]
MNEYIFTDFLRSNVVLSSEQMAALFEGSRVLEPKKGEFLLSAGEICRHRFFIERGAVREYSIDERGREHLLHFALEGWFLMNVESIFFDQPSSYFIEAIEPSRVLLLDDKQFRKLAAENEAFERFDKSLLHEHIHTLQHRITALQSSSAEERYRLFTKQYPEVMLRVPQMMIASYLGITPESLSRIRKELAQRNCRPRNTS